MMMMMMMMMMIIIIIIYIIYNVTRAFQQRRRTAHPEASINWRQNDASTSGTVSMRKPSKPTLFTALSMNAKNA